MAGSGSVSNEYGSETLLLGQSEKDRATPQRFAAEYV
jgi:hypothetical protein